MRFCNPVQMGEKLIAELKPVGTYLISTKQKGKEATMVP